MTKRKPVASAAPMVRMPKRQTPPDDIPVVIANASLNDHLEIMTRAIFQSGLSWAMITARWDSFREAFERFDVSAVARYGDFELERLMTAQNIIHSEKKIAGTFANARMLIAIDREFGSVALYASAHGSYNELRADVHRRFAFMGDLSCYYWLFRTANAVPLFEDWMAAQDRDHPRMREMVLRARISNMSSERAGF